ncbi:protein NRT1/ PTR FAMILY 8.3-like [Panicum miliaceum]|uniref:Protein NRT1/ PTR FAMILY 8.3-like n=1 Tax=Panicum miliaceum TaxID=4540 RepID=A0A3L6S9D4_PANMI|nr:protein NRT1/ PTR FAMILY 8.3-like [Panicum miliaceum]
MAAMSISASFLKGGSSQSVVFFLGLYMMAIGAGGIKPCVSSFGADQFDDSSPAERLKKYSFFNWFFFATYIGSFVSGTAVVWVQDHYGWAVGLWLPTLFIALAIASFLLGSSKYRMQKPMGSPIVRVFQVIVAAIRKWNAVLPYDDSLLHELPEKTPMAADIHKLQHTPALRFLDKAAVISSTEDPSDSDPWRLCTVTQVEELKVIIGMLPIWTTGIVFFAVLAQFSSTFLEQGRSMDKHVGAFAVPPASLASFDAVSVLIWVPVYDRVLVPAARRLTGSARGISELQRYGAGLLLSILVMVAAALVETRRLALASAHGEGQSSMSILWQVPQYFLVGASVVFTCVGQTEFFYNEAPPSMRSLCSALALLTVALGSYVSSLVVTTVAWLTTRGGGPGWIPDDLNDGHLERFFWLLAAMSALNLAVFVYCATQYKRKTVS